MDLEIFDGVLARLFASLDLSVTMDAIVDVLVPHWADWASLTVDDQRGVTSNVVRGELASGVTQHTVLLSGEGGVFGSLQLAPNAERPDAWSHDIERIVPHAARALSNARRFERERNVALTFQDAAVDTHLPQLGDFTFDALYRAGSAEALVGGDWYDAFTIRDGRVVVSIGDVVGSGLDAAIAMVNVRQAIRGVAQVHPDPALMLEAADQTVRAQHPDRYVTAFVGVIDSVTQQCAYANAGHPKPFIRLAEGTVLQAPGRGMPIGLGFEQTLEVHHIALPPGSLFVLYTDGLTEATKDVAEGERRLEQILRDPALMLDGRIALRIHESVVGAHARDDVAILVVKAGSSGTIRRWRFDPAWPDLARRTRRQLCAELAQRGFGDDALLDVELVFAELMGNLVRYAGGTAELILEVQRDRLVMHLLDKGPGFQFAPRLPADLFSQTGRGLYLISRLSDEFSVERRPGGGSHARIVLRSSPPKEVLR